MATQLAPVLVIVGPTASGKTELAVKIAKKYSGEIICGDSQTLRREMNIGTAKPSIKDVAKVSHHLLDIIGPYDKFSAAEFQKQANKKIKEITHRGYLPIIVGGSGLYIDSFIYNYDFSKPAGPKIRAELMKKSINELQEIIEKNKFPMPENDKNPRHLIRTIETKGKKPNNKQPRKHTLIIGIDVDKEELNQRIQKRAHKMIEDGLIDEVKMLKEKYGNPPEHFDTIGYKLIFEDLKSGSEIDQNIIEKKLIQAHKDLAKRQRTWFKRNKNIAWINNFTDTKKQIDNFLSKFDTISS